MTSERDSRFEKIGDVVSIFRRDDTDRATFIL